MAIQEFEPQAEPEIPMVALLREVGGQEPIYYFLIDGEDTQLTITREKVDETPSDFTYHLIYKDWEYGEADVHCGTDVASIEWQGIADGQTNSLAAIEAEKFMQDSGEFLLAAIRTDFPGLPVEDVHGNLL